MSTHELPDDTPDKSTPQLVALVTDLAGVAVLLGVGKSTAQAWHSEGRLPLPTIGIGKVLRWSLVELESWLLSGSPRRAAWVGIRDGAIRKFLSAKGSGVN